MVWTWSPQEYPPEKCCWKHHKRYYEDISKEVEAADIIEELCPEPKDYIVEKYGRVLTTEEFLKELAEARG